MTKLKLQVWTGWDYVDRLIRHILFRDPWVGLLVEFRWFRKYIGGTWQQWNMDQPLGGASWFRGEEGIRPHPLCRGTAYIERWPNVRDHQSPLASGAAPAREAGLAGGGTEVPKGW